MLFLKQHLIIKPHSEPNYAMGYYLPIEGAIKVDYVMKREQEKFNRYN